MTSHFVQRGEMAQLDAFFRTASQTVRRKIFVVHGLGGIGKTQLCVEFARKQQDNFSGIFWLDGSSKDALRQSLANAGLRVSNVNASTPLYLTQTAAGVQESIDSFLQWLGWPGNTRWLLIFDNVDRDWQTRPNNEQAFNYEDFLPGADHGNVIVTTRLARLQIPEASLHLDKVNNTVGQEILEKRAGKRLLGS